MAAKGTDPEAAKAFVKWLWVDNTADQLNFSTAFGYHVPARMSLVDQADRLKSGPAKDAVSFTENLGHGPSLLWSQATSDAFLAAFSNVVLKGANPQTAIQQVGAKCTSEIKRLTS